MNAPATIGAGKPTLRIRGTPYPVLLPSWRDPRLHLAAVIISLAGTRPGRVRLPALDRADPRLPPDLRGARGRDRVPPPARADVARERAPDRQRRRLHPPRPRHRARRLVEPARLVDLLGDRGRIAALEAPDPVPGASHLQPVELRPRALLPAARLGVRRSAGVLVGADVAVAGARPRDHRRGRVRDPAPAAPARDRGDLLDHVRRVARGARRERARDDGALAPRAGVGLVLLARPRVLARDPRLPLLHDHRPEDDPGRKDGAPRLRRRDRAAGGAPARAPDERVRLEGRGALGAGARLRRPARARAGRRSARRTRARPGSRSGRARGRSGLRRTARRGGEPCPLERRGDDPSGCGRPPPRGDRRAGGRDRAGRPADGGADRAGRRRRPRQRGRRTAPPRPHTRHGRRGRSPACVALAADRRRRGRSSPRATPSRPSASGSSRATARHRRPWSPG